METMKRIRIFSREDSRTNKVFWCYEFNGNRKETIVNGKTQYKRTIIRRQGFKTRAEAEEAAQRHVADYYSSKVSND